MKKVLLVFAAIAMAIAFVPAASAGTLAFNQISSTVTLKSDVPGDTGSDVGLIIGYINNTGGSSLTIDAFEVYLGGTGVTGASGDNPTQFGNADNGYTYSLGTGGTHDGYDFDNSKGTKWSKNTSPTIGDAVAPKDKSTKDYLDAVTLENSSSVGILDGPDGDLPACYTGETLAAGAECYVELLVSPTYGSIGTYSKTFIYGYAFGKNAAGDDEANGMQENIEVSSAPEPGALALMGTGFGLLGFALFLRKRFAHSQATAHQPTVA